MTIDPIHLGSAPNDGTGQNLRSGGQTINDNFAELDTRTATAQATAEQGVAQAVDAKAKADAAIPASALGATVAQLVNGTVPQSQLPSDVLEFATLAGFPATGESGKIYIAVNDGDSLSNPSKQYRWNGWSFVLIPSSPGSTDQVAEGATNQYFTAARVRSTTLTGMGSLVNAAVVANDTLLQAIDKLQGQLNAKLGKGEVAVDSDKLGGKPSSSYTSTMTGATAATAGTKGLVPAPAAGDHERFLNGAGTYSSPTVGAVGWGGITGDITKQVDLKAAFDAKLSRTGILGSVSQSSGVPTGAIIESGNNANGTYTKFADGTLICTYAGTIPIACPIGGTISSRVFPFPATFVGKWNPMYTGHVTDSSGGIYYSIGMFDIAVASGVAGWMFTIRNTGGAAITQIIGGSLFAIGRWF
ncbi:hypothetical protein M5G25_02440 [Pseudomonas sp. TNT2022 ID357]|uniref:Phage tail fibre repeat-containing protein n=1 Tax=Pseudomonas idahonensis TaxID=2942628 RepID=A0ABT5PZF8_9PSED|nr:hypothetical protein [Pseudomonas idahonensis]MDD1147125.1 hypothetical protein [Pseudomonas idahonensis]